MSGHSVRSFCSLLLVASLLAVAPGVQAEDHIANVMFEAQVPAPTVALAASMDGSDVLVVDEESRFTFIPQLGADELVWTAPKTGTLAKIDPLMGEVDPTPVGVAVTPSGEHWAGAVRYEAEFGGHLWGFARWSDQPIWTYDLTDGAQQADQPTVVTAGGPYVVMGTEKGRVHVFKAAEATGEKLPYRTYKADNDGNAFGRIGDVDVSRDGKRFLIGTSATEKGSLHLYSDVFYMYNFKRVTDTVHTVAISADGTRGAAVAGQGATARLHLLDLTRGKTIWETTLGVDVPALAFSADGKTLAAGTEDGNVLVFYERGLPDDREPLLEHAFVDAITSVDVADDGRAIIAGTDAGKLHFLDRDRNVPLWTYDTGSAIVGTAVGADAELVVLSARTQDDARVIFTAADHSIEHIAPPQPRLAPGAINTLPIDIANNGNRMETVRVVWGTLPSGWEGLAGNVTVAPGETRTISAKISVVKGQSAGTFPVPLTLKTDTRSIPMAISAVVPEMTSGRTSESWSLAAAVPGGAPAAFVLKVENTGNTLNEASLGYAKLPAGWRAEFIGTSEFRLKPGEDRQVALKAWAPADAATGREAWFDIVVSWTHGEERVPVTVRVVDGPTYRQLLALESDKPEGGFMPTELHEASLKPQAKPGGSKSKDTPGVGVAAILVVGLLGLVAAQRRRQP